MNYTYKQINLVDIPFLHYLGKTNEYQDIFFENNTTEEMWESRFDAIRNFQIVFDNEKRIGMVNYLINQSTVELLLIVIDINLLGQGVGTKILKDLFNLYPNYSFEVNVMKSNERAVKFYQKNGFVITNEMIVDYGENGQHQSYDMRREITSK